MLLFLCTKSACFLSKIRQRLCSVQADSFIMIGSIIPHALTRSCMLRNKASWAKKSCQVQKTIYRNIYSAFKRNVEYRDRKCILIRSFHPYQNNKLTFHYGRNLTSIYCAIYRLITGFYNQHRKRHRLKTQRWTDRSSTQQMLYTVRYGCQLQWTLESIPPQKL